MRTILILFVICLTVYGFGQTINNSSAITKADSSVIKIYTINERNQYEKQGSGVVITSNGICLSNYHVFIGAKRAIAITIDGREYNISTVIDFSNSQRDGGNDLIKFKIDLGNDKLIPADINLNLPSKGQQVFALGFPNGFRVGGESTYSDGVVSAIRTENNERIIQTSTPFTHGSSGGGLFDFSGKLLGITQGTFANEYEDLHANLNRVIPIYLAHKLTRNLNINLSRFYQEIKNESFIKGQIAYDQLEFEIAADHFLEHIDEYPGDGIAWFRLGNCLNQLGRRSLDKELLDNALNCFNTSISLDSNYYHAWGQAALIYSATGRIDLAKYCAGKAYEIEPNVSFTNYVIGKVANEAKQYELAVTFLMAAINLSDDFDKQNFTHQWYLEKAIANAWLKRDYDAEKDYKICLSLNSNNLDALFWYGNFLGIRKRTSEACEQFKKLKTLSPYYKMSGYSVDQMIQNYRCR